VSTFESLSRRFQARLPSISPVLAEDFISNAWKRIQGERQWSFMRRLGTVNFPSSLTTGTCSVTRGSTTLTFNAAAIAAIQADTSLPLLAYRQIRLPGEPDRIFRISFVDADFATNGIVTLEDVYLGTTNTTSTYQLYNAYNIHLKGDGGVEQRVGAVLYYRSRYLSASYLTAKHKVDQARLHLNDPGRTSMGIPRNFAFSHVKQVDMGDYTYDIPFLEFWPHCTSALTLETQYLVTPTSFREDETQLTPSHIDDELIFRAALIEAYSWCEANKMNNPELRGVNWVFLKSQLVGGVNAMHDPSTYSHLLHKCKKRDDSYINDTLIPAELYRRTLIDGNMYPTSVVVGIRS